MNISHHSPVRGPARMQHFRMSESLTQPNAQHGESDWYLIQCKPRQDERAEENLVRQGYACYRPMHTCEKIARGKRQMVKESLFPGYLFIQLSRLDNWAPLRSTRGVSRLVTFGNQPTPIDANLISQLQRRCSATPPDQFLESGDKVRIDQGPFAELEAIFLSMDGNERVVILMNILQRDQKIRVPLSSIRKIE